MSSIMTTDAPLARTSSGLLRGSSENGIHVFRKVPYAAPPVGALRFARPAPVESWQGERDATQDGPVPLQPVSRLRAAMGDFQADQGEDCLSLTITTPGVDKGRRPVLIWLHGGAFWTGAGSIDWYSGASLSHHGDMVVVGVNYRLGALGFLDIPGVSDPNLGLHDQIAALEWVHREIESFGGDPDNITVAGQSAGGLSILAMLGHPGCRKMIRRAIVQSAPFGRLLKTRAESQAIAEAIAKKIGITDPGQWRTVSAQSINEAQLVVARSMAAFANTTPAFLPVIDHELLGEDIIGAALAGMAGAMLTPIYSITPTVGGNFILAAFAVVVLGGLGSVWGAYWGGLIVGVVEALAGFYIDPVLRSAIWFLIFLVVLVVKPAGLLGQVGAEEVGFREQH